MVIMLTILGQESMSSVVTISTIYCIDKYLDGNSSGLSKRIRLLIQICEIFNFVFYLIFCNFLIYEKKYLRSIFSVSFAVLKLKLSKWRGNYDCKKKIYYKLVVGFIHLLCQHRQKILQISFFFIFCLTRLFGIFRNFCF